VKTNNKIIYKNSIPKKYLRIKSNKTINKRCFTILKSITENLDTTEDALHTLSSKFKFNFKITEIERFKKFNTIVVIGMGGSILGIKAIYFFLKKKIKKHFIFFDNIDETKLYDLKKNRKFNTVLFIVISKSGKTIETLSNISALKVVKKESKNIIIISEKNNNPLYLLSEKMKIFYIEHKKFIGGRYSVLSEIGMFPAYLMGIKISKLRKNILNPLKHKNKKFLSESAINLSSLLNIKKIKNVIFFNYVPQLNKFHIWCQQLMAESLGKKSKGFLPMLSPAPKDHHSLLQLYLDGPKDKIFYIFSCTEDKNRNINSKIFGDKLSLINKKSLGQIKTAQKNAFLQILKKKEIPYREFKIPNFNEEVLGELFAYFILETAIVGKLSNINPFDQPAVELVKTNTKKNLS
jgi:glucose-6-phosphate isomerase